MGNRGWHTWEEQAGISAYPGEMEQAWQLEGSWRGLALEKGDVPLP